MRRLFWLGSVVSLAACGGSPAPAADAGLSADGGGGVDSATVRDAASPEDAVTLGAPLHECEEADFVDRTSGPDDSRMIMVPTGTTIFDQPCITIREGQSVMFMWNFTPHPLGVGVAPGHPGTSTAPSPIEPRTSGMLYTVAFPTAGDYGYYCATHFHAGMYGVVRVVP